MNEYTYKAKKIEDGEWTQGSLFAGLNNHLIIQSVNLKENTFVGSLVDKDTTCKYAGNGLWEHDIIFVVGRVGVIKYGLHDGGNGFYVDWKRTVEGDSEEALYTLAWVRADKVLLLGNDIDNSVEEILKKVEECLSERE